MNIIPLDDKRLSIFNTKQDIAQILMREATGDAHMGKAAVYQMAGMLLGGDRQNDMVEYLLLIGNRIHYVREEDVWSYIHSKDSGMSHALIMRNIILNQGNSDEVNLEDKMRERIFGIFRSPSIPTAPASSHEKAYVPQDVEDIAGRLLESFPLLQRVDVQDYSDLSDVIEAGEIMGRLSQAYKKQILGSVESRIDDIIAGRKAGRCTAQDVLYKATIAYLIENWIEHTSPKPSGKHKADPRLSLITAVSNLHPADIEFGDSFRTAHALYMDNYSDPDMFKFYQMHTRRSQARTQFKSRKDQMRYADDIMGKIPSAMDALDRIALKKVLLAIKDKKPENDFPWRYLKAAWSDILDMDSIGFLAFAAASGLREKVRYGRNDEERLSGLRIDFEDQNHSTKSSQKLKSLTTEHVAIRMLASYTYNQLIGQVMISGQSNAWEPASRYAESYTHQDFAVAESLYRRYPVFSRIPASSYQDVMSGIGLSMIQRITGDYSVIDASITQNFLLKQLRHIYNGYN